MKKIIAVMAACFLTFACKEKEQPREYQEVENLAPNLPAQTNSPSNLPAGHPPLGATMPTSENESATPSPYQWTLPEGWTESPGSGMRFITFKVPEKSIEISGIALAGDAGGLKPNISRWMGQLGIVVPAGEKFDAFLEKQKSYSTKAGWKVKIVDLTSFLSGNMTETRSMIVGIIHTNDSTIFLKMVGPKKKLGSEKANLTALAKSLKNA